MRVDEDEMRMGGSEAVERSQNNINIWTPYRPHKRPLGGVSRSPANFVLCSGRNPMRQLLYIFYITMLCTRSSHTCTCIISYLYQDRIGEISRSASLLEVNFSDSDTIPVRLLSSLVATFSSTSGGLISHVRLSFPAQDPGSSLPGWYQSASM